MPDFKTSKTPLAPSTKNRCSCLRYFFNCRDFKYFIKRFDSIGQEFVKQGFRFFGFLLPLLCLGSCVGLQHLEDGEKLLYKQSITGTGKAERNKLSREILLRPNNRIPIFGALGVHLYEIGKNAFDTAKVRERKRNFIAGINKKIAQRTAKGKKITSLQTKKRRKTEHFNKLLRNGNFLMRTGTPLAVYDSALIEQSRLRILNQLRDDGYFSAVVEVKIKERRRKITQAFVVQTGKQRYIDSLNLRTGDEAITKLIKDHEKESFFRLNDAYKVENLEKERTRLNNLLRNNGYFEMTESFINFEVRLAPGETDLWVTTVINKPANKPTHVTYQMDSIIVNTSGAEPVSDNEDYRGIHYARGAFPYSARVLDTRITFRPGDTYNYSDVVNTQRQLINMDLFKYVNINFDTTLVPGKFVTNIYTAPLKKFQLTQELGVNVSQGWPGPFYNLSFINRNIFRGLEIFSLNTFIGSEGLSPLTDQSGIYRSLQYGVNAALTFPRFLTPFRSRRLNLNTFNPKTTVTLGYSYTNRPEYIRENLNGTYAFTWQNLQGTQTYTLNLANVNLIQAGIESDFLRQLNELANQGNTFQLAFLPSFVSSTSFNAVINKDYSNPYRPSSFLRYFIESGGLMYKAVGTRFLKDNNLEFYQFTKFELDYRHYIPGKKGSAWVCRAHAGVAKPYGDNEALPYEKFFFSGGSSSNRAWNPRRLGPGSSFPYLLDENGNNLRDKDGNPVPDRHNYRFEQPGEVLLELNVEYRSKLAGFIDWAFFIDAGNTWLLKEIKTNTDGTVRASSGSGFRFNRFYKEIAVGAGLGLRLDFSFLVFRLDLGHKLRNPRFEEGQRWQRPFKRSSQTVWNIAVGYPF